MTKTALFIPEKINVGFQERRDTYTGKLAYVIYYDEKGKLRKEKSWQDWRDENIPNQEFENIPTEGFVLNKKVGGYQSGWDYRQSYIRVYDPRGFEFEITVENLLYIMENYTCIPGKGIEGKCVYSWDGTELVLLPVNSPDYEKIQQFTQKINDFANADNENKITNKNLKIGYIYKKRNGDVLTYLGRYEYFDYQGNSQGMKYIFARHHERGYRDRFDFYLQEMASANGKFIEVSDTQDEEIDEMLELIKHSFRLSPEDRTEDIPITLDKYLEMKGVHALYFYEKGIKYHIDGFVYKADKKKKIMANGFPFYFYDGKDYLSGKISREEEIDFDEACTVEGQDVEIFKKCGYYNKEEGGLIKIKTTLRQFFNDYEVFVQNTYLKNGELYYDGMKNERIFDR